MKKVLTISICCYIALLLNCLTAFALQEKGKNIDRFLRPDGRIDLEKAQQSDFQGAFDITGYEMGIDPKTGDPVMRFADADSDPDDIYWTEGLSYKNGFDTYDSPTSMIMYDGNLIVAGSFVAVGNVSASNIASWNGSNWAPLDTGLSGWVRALAVYDNKLIASVCCDELVSWDGSSWESIDNGPEGQIYAMTIFDNKLIAGGVFYSVGGDSSIKYIASWDGISLPGME